MTQSRFGQSLNSSNNPSQVFFAQTDGARADAIQHSKLETAEERPATGAPEQRTPSGRSTELSGGGRKLGLPSMQVDFPSRIAVNRHHFPVKQSNALANFEQIAALTKIHEMKFAIPVG